MLAGSAAIGALVRPISEMDWLECDGLSRVLHAFLVREKEAHTLYNGTVFNKTTGSGHGEHYWILLHTYGRIIDYRATW